MGVIAKVLLVVFIIVCALLVLLVAIQDDGESGMGGLLGGRGTAAFGSHSASVLTKTTCVLVVLFFGLAIGLAVVNKQSVDINIDANTEVEETSETVETEKENWWNQAEEKVEEAITPAVEAAEEAVDNVVETIEGAVEAVTE